MIVADPTQRRVPSHLALVRDTAFLASLEATQRQDFESFAVVQTQRTWARIRAEVKGGFDLADAAFMARLKAHRYAFSFDVDAVATLFAKPVLIVAGRQDGIVGYRDAWGILEHYPRATFAVLDRAGHNVQIEQERLFNALVSDWLERVEEQWVQGA